jgi:uncharacterized protein YndB with AHSA1/START domain
MSACGRPIRPWDNAPGIAAGIAQHRELSMIKTIAVIVAVVLAVGIATVLVLAAGKPDTFQIQRSATIEAPPERIFPLIEDFRQWTAWSPYEKKDPAMKRTFSGADKGPGAVYAFEGNGQVGSGRLTMTETVPSSKVALTLDMIKPMQAHNNITFTLAPQGDATTVTWAMQGQTPFLGKIFHVIFNMDRMVGGDFEKGLADLKAAAEGARTAAIEGPQP